jgi:LPXTG-motif cell wall-anchored protein
MTTLTAVDVQEGQAWKAPILRNCVPNPPEGDTLLPDCQHFLCTQGFHQFCQKTTTTTASTSSQPSSTTGAPTTLSSSPTTTPLVATTVAPTPPSTGATRICFEDGSCRDVNPNAPQWCQEDEPCWDCHTMGNKICGTQSAVTQAAKPTVTVLPHTGSTTAPELGFAGVLFAVAGLLAIARKVFKPA